jgi:AcrR family transcriptional regulator
VPGLRERKKAKTRAAIQAEALRLFREQGYDATTVEQICEAAEVSESTFYRYFPNKPDVVLYDELDPLLIQALKDQPHDVTPLAAIRAAFQTIFGALTAAQQTEQLQRSTLSLAVPELRATVLDQLAQGIELLSHILAERANRSAPDLADRTLAGAVVGAIMAVWFASADNPGADMAAIIDQALAQLETGFTT